MYSFLKLARNQRNFLIPFTFIAVFISLALIKVPIKQVFEYDPDEGAALMKSQLYVHGFSLYKEIYDDQPPLLTVILSFCLKLFGPSIYHARILTLIFSGILLWVLYLIIMSLNGALCAIITVIFLALSTYYLQLSLSVMPAIPSLSFALLSIYCAIRYKKNYSNWLLLFSGIFMAISLQIKLITVFLTPLILLEIILAEKLKANAQKKQNRLLHVIFFWLSGFAVMYFTITIIFFRFNFFLLYQQLFLPHLKRLIVERGNFAVISRLLFTDYDITILALISLIIPAQGRKKQLYFPLLWLTLISLILLIHRPLWHHYYPLIAIPLCWLAASSFKEFFQRAARQNLFKKIAFGDNFLPALLTKKRFSVVSRHIYTFLYHKKIAFGDSFLPALLTKKRFSVVSRHIYTFLYHKKIAFGDNFLPALLTKKRFSVVSRHIYTFLYHKKKGAVSLITAAFVILTIFRMPVKYHRMFDSVNNGAAIEERKVVNLLLAHKKNTRWILTDRPIFAFYAGILVPPELALISNKRISAKDFTRDYLISLLEKYNPEQILLTRFKIYENKLLPSIEKNYVEIYQATPYNRIWVPLYLQYKLPPVQGGRSYISSGKDLKLYLLKPQ